ncbi:MAG TPA: hypothetical protein VNI20_11175 [Fimbriimonadaceae bacterium]|nr:hypothetical protein [Fimbriimonadaceae bacterium]
MTIRHTVLFSVLAIIGGMVGGALFGRTIPVEAQIKQFPPVRSENYIVVPNEGLRFITDKSKPIAYLGQQGGGTVFVLLDDQGSPSVALASGTGGTVTIRAQQGGGKIEVASEDHNTVARMSVTTGAAQFDGQVQRSVSTFGSNVGGGTLSISKPDGNSALELKATKQGGFATIFGAMSRSALTLEGGANGGIFNVRDSMGTTTASVVGTGAFSSLKDGKTVWHAP